MLVAQPRISGYPGPGYRARAHARSLAPDRIPPGRTAVPGLAVTAAALVVMPVLAIAKRRTGQALGNRTLVADSAETAFCAFTSAAALLGVGLDAWLGWWWADPAAALVIAALAVKEGLECWEPEDDALPRRCCKLGDGKPGETPVCRTRSAQRSRLDPNAA